MTQFNSLAQGAIRYNVSFPKANLHYTTVQITVETRGEDHIDFSMPVWTPGSYMIREFSQHVDRFVADGDSLVTRLDKNTWRVDSRNRSKIQITYDVYAFSLSVRHSYVDQYHAFLHGVSAFMRVNRESDEIVLSFEPLAGWKNLEVALPRKDGEENTFICTDFDLLADSPIAIGNFDILKFESGGVPHKVVMIGEGNYDAQKIIADFKKIGDTEVNIFKEHPSTPCYIHFVQNVESGSGGLEHLNCQTSQVSRTAYRDDDKYLKFLGLIAHEQFHLWNVKRIRPVELGPFNYDTENYTRQLWVAEGITSYYDDLVLLRSGIHTVDSYLEEVAGNINRLQNTPGRANMSLEDSSFTAWVKFYRSNENSGNATISYYNKGMLVAMVLDIEIIRRTNGQRSMDDLLRALYAFYKEEDKGFSVDEFWTIVEQVAGADLRDMYHKYIVETDEIDYSLYLDHVGVNLKDENKEKNDPWLGITTKEEKGRCIITSVHLSGTGAAAGLSVNDEVIAINGYRISGDAKENIKMLPVGSVADITLSRDGKLLNLPVEVKKDTEVKYKLVLKEDPSETQSALRSFWLGNR